MFTNLVASHHGAFALQTTSRRGGSEAEGSGGRGGGQTTSRGGSQVGDIIVWRPVNGCGHHVLWRDKWSGGLWYEADDHRQVMGVRALQAEGSRRGGGGSSTSGGGGPPHGFGG